MSPLFKQRRQHFITQMAANSVAIFTAASPKIRSRDTEYPYCQDKYFYYLTGFNEPDSVLLIFSGSDESNTPPSCLVFCRENDPLAEIWHGRRLGTHKAVSELIMDSAIDIKDLNAQLRSLLNGKQKLYWAQGENPLIDSQINTAISELRAGERLDKKPPQEIVDWRALLDEMRLIKSEQEIAIIQKAVDISIQGHLRAMKTCCSGLMEYQLQAHIEHEFAYNGGRYPAYSSIVGSGDNACILHYTENNQVLKNGELVLIDAGAEYQAYAGDITRTLPINGKFTPAQKQLYHLVLTAQLEAIKHMVPKGNIQQAQSAAIAVLSSGLIDLGILSGELTQVIKDEAYKAYFMHGIGHWLGLDVHDVGSYGGSQRQRPFEAGMVLTVEPGLYISKTADVPEQYKGIGIRIEDNLVITAIGNKILSQNLPKTIEAIEGIMQAQGQ